MYIMAQLWRNLVILLDSMTLSILCAIIEARVEYRSYFPHVGPIRSINTLLPTWHEHLSAQTKNPPVCAQEGGRYLLPSKNPFHLEFLHKNCTIGKGHETLLICEENKFSQFQNGGHWKFFVSCYCAIPWNLKNRFPDGIFSRCYSGVIL